MQKNLSERWINILLGSDVWHWSNAANPLAFISAGSFFEGSVAILQFIVQSCLICENFAYEKWHQWLHRFNIWKIWKKSFKFPKNFSTFLQYKILSEDFGFKKYFSFSKPKVWKILKIPVKSSFSSKQNIYSCLLLEVVSILSISSCWNFARLPDKSIWNTIYPIELSVWWHWLGVSSPSEACWPCAT